MNKTAIICVAGVSCHFWFQKIETSACPKYFVTTVDLKENISFEIKQINDRWRIILPAPLWIIASETALINALDD